MSSQETRSTQNNQPSRNSQQKYSPKISPVEDNMDKYYTYKEIMEKYNRAIDNGFYFEAIFIDYACIEDRLRSMLYHMAIFYRSENVDDWGSRPFLSQKIQNAYKNMSENTILSQLTISDKMHIIHNIITWAHSTQESYQDNSYLSTLKRFCEGIEIQDALFDIYEWDHSSQWNKYRNELTHNLLNKNIDSVNEIIKPCAEKGMEIAKKLDTISKHIKKNHEIRNSIGAPIE